MAQKSINVFPTRYEPLVTAFGDAARNTFVRQDEDLEFVSKLAQQQRSAGQSKICFVYAPSESGAGKTTFIQSLDLFLPDLLAKVHRIGTDKTLDLNELAVEVGKVPKSQDGRLTVVNIDGHESFVSNDEEYRRFLVQLNNILRNRSNLLILWPVNNRAFADKVVGMMRKVGGMSPFGTQPIYEMAGLPNAVWPSVLDSILKVANWALEDAALDWPTVEQVTTGASNIGDYLDRIQAAIAEKFQIEGVGFEPPQLVIVLSSGKREVREICRTLRRADSYYAEASRLLMYTKRSNVAEWWAERNKELKTCLSHIIALFNVQIVSVSGSSVVHAVLNFGDGDLRNIPESVQRNIGNAKVVMKATELCKFSNGDEIDNREYGISTQEATLAAYQSIQAKSADRHKAINQAVMQLLDASGTSFANHEFERPAAGALNLIVDVTTTSERVPRPIYLEFHHKSDNETTNNKVSIYVLEKLKEYAINYRIAQP
jgi:hypothetical protein